MASKPNRYGVTVDQLQPGKFFWHESEGTGLIITVNGIAYTTFMLGGNANQGVMEGGDVQFVEEITPFDIFHALRALNRFNPQAIPQRWAKLRRKAKLPDGYRIEVTYEAGTDWPVTFHCNCINYVSHGFTPDPTTPRWRGVRKAARECLEECAQATSFERDWHSEQSRRLGLEVEVNDLKAQIEKLKAKRKARKR